MFRNRFSLPSVGRKLGGVALGLASIGLGFAFAQDRGRVVLNNLPQDSPQSAGRPTGQVDRPTGQVNRPPVRGATERPTPRGAEPMPGGSRGQINRGTPRLDTQSRTATPVLAVPRPMVRCTVEPDNAYWQRQYLDIMAEIQAMARRGNIAVRPIGEDVSEFTGVAVFPAGWTAYGFRVPAGESIGVSLHHSNRGWFGLQMVNKWGSMERGMLQQNPGTAAQKYTNPSKETRSVYVIVNDPGWMSSKANPFSMNVTRSWNPAQKKVDDAQVVTGIWAQKKEEASPDSEAKGIPAATPVKS